MSAHDRAAVLPAATLDARGLRWSAGGTLILDDVDLHARPGTMLGVIGPNGSGKSSLVRCVAGLTRADSGRIRLDDRDTASMTGRELARRLAFVAQEAATDIDLRVEDVVHLGRLPHRGRFGDRPADDEHIAHAALQDVGLGGFERRRWSTLSGGERQRVHVARALTQQPALLVLDEPLNHLDVHHQFELLDLLAASAMTVVMVLHDISLAARYCDDLVVMDGGRVVAAGSPRAVVTPSLLAEVFRVHGDVAHRVDGVDVRLTGSVRS